MKKIANWAFQLRLNDVDKALTAFDYKELNYQQIDSLSKKLRSYCKILNDAQNVINLNK